MTPAPPADAPVQLVFLGECLDGHDPQAVRRAVAAALKLDEARTAKLFSGRRVLLRRKVDAAKAHRIIVRFAALGARLHAEPSPLRPAELEPPAPPRPRQRRRPSRRRRWRPLQWAALGLGAVAGGLAIGLVLGPGLGALWPETPPGPAQATTMRQEPGTTAALVPGAVATTDTDPEIPPEMGPDALREYRQRYLVAPNPKAFALSVGGAFGWHAGAATGNDARERAQAACIAALGPGDDGCLIVNADGVWQK